MNKEDFSGALRFLLSKFKNPIFTVSVTNRVPENSFSFDGLIDAVKRCLDNVDVIFESDNDGLISELESAVKTLVGFAQEGVDSSNIEYFLDQALFVMDNAPKSTNLQSVEASSIMPQISREEFSERYDKLVDLLLDHKGENSNLILETESEKTPFKLFRRGGSIAIKAGGERTTMSISKDRLLGVAYDRQEPYYKSYEPVIIKKIIDNSIFDFITNQTETANDEELVSVLNEKVKRQDAELTKLQEAVTQYEFLVNEVREAKNSIMATRDDVAYEEAYKFWQDKSDRHEKYYWIYGGVSIVLTISLLCFFYWFLSANFNHVDFSYFKDINQTDTNKTAYAQIGFWEKFAVNKIWIYTFIVVAMSMGIWLARIAVKLTLSNYHIFVDANERVVMIKTYIALVKQGAGLDNNDRTTIFNALFRSTAFGAINDEPNMLLLEALAKSKG